MVGKGLRRTLPVQDCTLYTVSHLFLQYVQIPYLVLVMLWDKAT